MTKKEALEILKERIDLGKKEYMNDIQDYIQALNTAYNALLNYDDSRDELCLKCENCKTNLESCKEGGTISKTNLKIILDERRIKGAELSRACNISLPIVYNLIAGRQYAWPKYRKAISEYLDIPESEIFTDEKGIADGGTEK